MKPKEKVCICCRSNIYILYVSFFEKKINEEEYNNKLLLIINEHSSKCNKIDRFICTFPCCGKIGDDKPNINKHYKSHFKEEMEGVIIPKKSNDFSSKEHALKVKKEKKK